MLSRGFINTHLRYGTKPLMAHLRSPTWLRRISRLYARIMFAPSRDMSFVPDSLSVGEQSVACLWCSMQARRADKVILYLHGGAYTIGDEVSHGAMVARIAGAAGLRAAFLKFRLAPEHPYPAALDDAVLAYRALLERGFAGHDIVLAGDSAGGGLVFALLLTIQAAELPKPAACVALSPWTDLTLSGDSYRDNAASDVMLPKAWLQRSRDAYVGSCNPTQPGISPGFGAFDAPPPAFIAWAGDELLASDSVALKDKLEAAGGEVECHTELGLPHVWTFYQGKFSPAERTIRQMAEFIQARTQHD